MASSPLLNELARAAARQRATHEAAAFALKDAPYWQERWRAEQKARTAALILEAVQELLTSEGNHENHNNR